MDTADIWDGLRGTVRSGVVTALAICDVDRDAVDLVAARGRLNRGALFLLLSGSKPGGFGPLDVEVAVGLELIHRSSVIRDDIQDGDALRRGRPTAHNVLGVAGALALSDLILMIGIRKVHDGSTSAATVLPAALEAMALGQYQDITGPGHEAFRSPYIVAERKTGALVGAVFELGSESAGAPQDAVAVLGDSGRKVGTAFQLLNDVRNVMLDEGRGRGQGSDLADGRFSSVALVAARAAAVGGDSSIETAVETVRLEAESRLREVSIQVACVASSLPDELRVVLSNGDLARLFVADQDPAVS